MKTNLSFPDSAKWFKLVGISSNSLGHEYVEE
jgi:hypothetical protein